MKCFWTIVLAFWSIHCSAEPLLLKNATVLDPSRQTVSVKNIVINDGKVESILAEPTKNFSGRVIDLQGKFLIPGLMDLHAHAWGNAAASPDPKKSQYTGLGGAAERFAYSGVTSFLDLGGSESNNLSWRDRQRLVPQGATMYAAGPVFTCTGGHGTEYPDADMPRVVNSPEDAKNQVADLVQKRHPNVIKLIYDHARSMPSMDKATMSAVIATAKSFGLKSIVHIGTWTDARETIEAGVDVVTHLYEAGKSEPRDGLSNGDISDSLVELMAARKVWVMPTMSVQSGLLHIVQNPAILNEPLLKATVTPEVLDTYRSVDPNFWMLKWQRPSLATYHRTLKKLVAKKIPILAGTDVGNVGVFLGFSVHQEMELLVEAGLSKWRALAATTTLPREFLGLPEWLKPGSSADFLVLEKSPLDKISNTRQIALVVERGVVVDRSSPPPPVTPPPEGP